MSIYDGTVSPTIIRTAIGPLAIGAVDYINGADAQPSGFMVTKHELEQVARYWLHERLDNNFIAVICGLSGSTEWRLEVYSTDRLNAIADALGTERLAELSDEVHKSYEKTVDPTDWRTFTVGSKEERREHLTERAAREERFYTRPFEVSARFPTRAREAFRVFCSVLEFGISPDGDQCERARFRLATRADADDLARRLRDLPIPGLEVEIVKVEQWSVPADGEFLDPPS